MNLLHYPLAAGQQHWAMILSLLQVRGDQSSGYLEGPNLHHCNPRQAWEIPDQECLL